ncbi:hypothetical protein [Tateyamaria pelophila]|uniref:hypothetical protein n=1 Tax=Tateyamaria pelophila TaxID=328415 RepID=UPI001CC15D54|nr:hypothetical protein [Tateyamaria pelophila]
MRKNVTTNRQQIESSANALKKHLWPKLAGKSNANTRQMYNALKDCRPHSDWPQGDQISLAGLARLMVLHTAQLDSIEKEGVTALGSRTGTTPIANPGLRVAQELLTQINASARRLGFTSIGMADTRAQASRTRQEREARRALSTHDLDECSGAAMM